MTHKIEIEINDDVLWGVLCRLSSMSTMQISQILSMWIGDEILIEHAKKVVSGLILSNYEVADFPEFKAIMSAKTDEESADGTN